MAACGLRIEAQRARRPPPAGGGERAHRAAARRWRRVRCGGDALHDDAGPRGSRAQDQRDLAKLLANGLSLCFGATAPNDVSDDNRSFRARFRGGGIACGRTSVLVFGSCQTWGLHMQSTLVTLRHVVVRGLAVLALVAIWSLGHIGALGLAGITTALTTATPASACRVGYCRIWGRRLRRGRGR